MLSALLKFVQEAFIKNQLTFLNLNLFNQNIVNSQAAMTVNYDKSEPNRAHVNTKIWLDNAISSQPSLFTIKVYKLDIT